MGKYFDWLKKNIYNTKEGGELVKQEEIEGKKYEKTGENLEEEYKIVEKKSREKIYISHMDSYFWDAGRFIIEQDKASIGMLQRIFKIGFNRAARIIDELCEAGIVGEENGSAPRKVLMSQEQFDELWCDDLIEVGENTEVEKEHKKQGIYTIKDVEKMLRTLFEIDADYSSDGKTLKNLNNFIVTSATNENQTDVINTLLAYNSPMTMRLILMDDSVINYNSYNSIPHMLIPVITNEEKFEAAINWCCAEMQDRVNKFVECGVKNIDSFNQKAIESEKEIFPKIVCIVNETSSFLKYVTMPLERIFLNSNMVGIYFILFSRFSLKSLSVGKVKELLEVVDSKRLCVLLSQNGDSSNQRIAIKDFDNMDGYQFEQFCADILRKNGFGNVEVTQGSGDHGIDILAEKDDITYAIQCKCYSSDIGNSAIQQAHTGKSLYNKDIAVVFTNRYFTQQAIKEAKQLSVKLWDRDKLNEMIRENKENDMEKI